ncbi:hypothetical protein EDB83DRAFT_438614 [Lactarius deliciosus]|nr:hypothetical protein EDB83DRAFT_438614 [Lactarius deliciosus]
MYSTTSSEHRAAGAARLYAQIWTRPWRAGSTRDAAGDLEHPSSSSFSSILRPPPFLPTRPCCQHWVGCSQMQPAARAPVPSSPNCPLYMLFHWPRSGAGVYRATGASSDVHTPSGRRGMRTRAPCALCFLVFRGLRREGESMDTISSGSWSPSLHVGRGRFARIGFGEGGRKRGEATRDYEDEERLQEGVDSITWLHAESAG